MSRKSAYERVANEQRRRCGPEAGAEERTKMLPSLSAEHAAQLRLFSSPSGRTEATTCLFFDLEPNDKGDGAAHSGVVPSFALRKICPLSQCGPFRVPCCALGMAANPDWAVLVPDFHHSCMATCAFAETSGARLVPGPDSRAMTPFDSLQMLSAIVSGTLYSCFGDGARDAGLLLFKYLTSAANTLHFSSMFARAAAVSKSDSAPPGGSSPPEVKEAKIAERKVPKGDAKDEGRKAEAKTALLGGDACARLAGRDASHAATAAYYAWARGLSEAGLRTAHAELLEGLDKQPELLHRSVTPRLEYFIVAATLLVGERAFCGRQWALLDAVLTRCMLRGQAAAKLPSAAAVCYSREELVTLLHTRSGIAPRLRYWAFIVCAMRLIAATDWCAPATQARCDEFSASLAELRKLTQSTHSLVALCHTILGPEAPPRAASPSAKPAVSAEAVSDPAAAEEKRAVPAPTLAASTAPMSGRAAAEEKRVARAPTLVASTAPMSGPAAAEEKRVAPAPAPAPAPASVAPAEDKRAACAEGKQADEGSVSESGGLTNEALADVLLQLGRQGADEKKYMCVSVREPTTQHLDAQIADNLRCAAAAKQREAHARAVMVAAGAKAASKTELGQALYKQFINERDYNTLTLLVMKLDALVAAQAPGLRPGFTLRAAARTARDDVLEQLQAKMHAQTLRHLRGAVPRRISMKWRAYAGAQAVAVAKEDLAQEDAAAGGEDAGVQLIPFASALRAAYELRRVYDSTECAICFCSGRRLFALHGDRRHSTCEPCSARIRAGAAARGERALCPFCRQAM